MKNIQYLILFCATCMFLTSCDKYKNSAEPSTVTYLPKITMMGESDIVLDCTATSYTDEGAIAEEAGSQIPVTTTITGHYYGSNAVDGVDQYEITYSAENKDGIPGAAMRSVLWPACNGDLVNSIAGMYTADVARNGSITPQYQGLGPIIVKDLGNGEYQISDAIGGYYDYGRGYGFHYAALGMVVKANHIPSNDFTHDDVVPVGDFGGNLTMTEFSVDPGTKTITFTTEWDLGYVFEVTMTQN